MNVKKKMMPVLQAMSMNTGFQREKFRRGLRMCREAGSEQLFERLWFEFLQKWIPNTKQRNKVRGYMQTYVFNVCKQELRDTSKTR